MLTVFDSSRLRQNQLWIGSRLMDSINFKTGWPFRKIIVRSFEYKGLLRFGGEAALPNEG